MSLAAQLERCRGKFGAQAARQTTGLLERAARTRFREPQQLIQLHEAVLFLRAYPQNARVRRLTDQILFAFGERTRGMPRREYEYAEISGIAGTGLTTNFSYPFARSLCERYPECVSLDWHQYRR